jgi:hypothetical protein
MIDMVIIDCAKVRLNPLPAAAFQILITSARS